MVLFLFLFHMKIHYYCNLRSQFVFQPAKFIISVAFKHHRRIIIHLMGGRQQTVDVIIHLVYRIDSVMLHNIQKSILNYRMPLIFKNTGIYNNATDIDQYIIIISHGCKVFLFSYFAKILLYLPFHL